MIGSRIPRFFLYATALGAVVAVVMLTLFFAQYRWLANQIVSASYEEHRVVLQGSFERRARAELHRIADQLPVGDGTTRATTLYSALNRALAEHPGVNGLRLKRTAAGSSTTREPFDGTVPSRAPCPVRKELPPLARS